MEEKEEEIFSDIFKETPCIISKLPFKKATWIKAILYERKVKGSHKFRVAFIIFDMTSILPDYMLY